MSKVFVSREKLIEAIVFYYSQTIDRPLDVDIQLSIFDDDIDIAFILKEHISDKKINYCQKRVLTKKDLEDVLAYYFDKNDYDLDGYKYVGGIRRFYIDEDMPYFEGFDIPVKKKGFSRKMTKN